LQISQKILNHFVVPIEVLLLITVVGTINGGLGLLLRH